MPTLSEFLNCLPLMVVVSPAMGLLWTHGVQWAGAGDRFVRRAVAVNAFITLLLAFGLGVAYGVEVANSLSAKDIAFPGGFLWGGHLHHLEGHWNLAGWNISLSAAINGFRLWPLIAISLWSWLTSWQLIRSESESFEPLTSPVTILWVQWPAVALVLSQDVFLWLSAFAMTGLSLAGMTAGSNRSSRRLAAGYLFTTMILSAVVAVIAVNSAWMRDQVTKPWFFDFQSLTIATRSWRESQINAFAIWNGIAAPVSLAMIFALFLFAGAFPFRIVWGQHFDDCPKWCAPLVSVILFATSFDLVNRWWPLIGNDVLRSSQWWSIWIILNLVVQSYALLASRFPETQIAPLVLAVALAGWLNHLPGGCTAGLWLVACQMLAIPCWLALRWDEVCLHAPSKPGWQGTLAVAIAAMFPLCGATWPMLKMVIAAGGEGDVMLTSILFAWGIAVYVAVKSIATPGLIERRLGPPAMAGVIVAIAATISPVVWQFTTSGSQRVLFPLDAEWEARLANPTLPDDADKDRPKPADGEGRP